MGQVRMTCPQCKEKSQAEEAEIYECPKCGTNVRAKKSDAADFDKTQTFHT